MSGEGNTTMFRPALRKYLSTILLCVVCALPEAINAQPKDASMSHLQARHREVMKGWLARKPNLRLANIADCTDKEGLAATREHFGKNHHPYYTAGDFNKDKREDFAVVLIDKLAKKKDSSFAIAIFNGPLSKDSVPAFFLEGADMSYSGLLASGYGILAGPFQSDDCVILSPRGKRYVMKDCLEE
jgi:hypothetical protein